MASLLNYYDILGVVTGAPPKDVLASYQAKVAVLEPRMIEGAPYSVLAVVDRARAAVDVAGQTLTDPIKRQQYDIEIGIVRPGSGLAGSNTASEPSTGLTTYTWDPAVYEAGLAVLADWLGPHTKHPWHVTVPDARGLFLSAARRMMELAGLKTGFTQLTQNPLPVEGLVVDQTPSAGKRRQPSTRVTVHVWHPSQQLQDRV